MARASVYDTDERSEDGWGPSVDPHESAPTRVAEAYRELPVPRSGALVLRSSEGGTNRRSFRDEEDVPTQALMLLDDEPRTHFQADPRTMAAPYCRPTAGRRAENDRAHDRGEELPTAALPTFTKRRAPSFAALAAPPLMVEERPTRLERHAAAPRPRMSSVHDDRLEREYDHREHDVIELPTTPVSERLGRPAQRSMDAIRERLAARASADVEVAFESNVIISSVPDSVPPKRPEYTLRSRGPEAMRVREAVARASDVRDPRAPAPPMKADVRTEPVGYPIVPTTAPLQTGAPVSPTGPTAFASGAYGAPPYGRDARGPSPTTGQHSTPASSNPVPMTSATPTPMAMAMATPEGRSWGRAGSGAWSESPWVVTSRPSRLQLSPNEGGGFSMIAAIAMGMVAFCVMVGAFLYVRSDNRSLEEARNVALQPSFGANSGSPSLPTVSSPPPAAAPVPAPAMLSLGDPTNNKTSTIDESSPTTSPRKAKGLSKTERAERAERAADAARAADARAERSDSKNEIKAADPAKADPTTTKTKTPKKTDKNGKSLEQILDELGEEQLRR